MLSREDGTPRPLFETGALAVEQVGERSFEVAADAGGLAGIPFEKLTARLVPALRDVTFHVPHGSVLAVVGRNGAGKSTLCRVISGVLPPEAGRVIVPP